MNSRYFVKSIKEIVSDSSIKTVEETLINPPGRSPDKSLIELSAWFKGLDEDNRKKVRSVIKNAVHTSVFGFFSVLDGVRAMEDGDEKGRLELNYLKDGKLVLINNFDDDALHDIYNEMK